MKWFNYCKIRQISLVLVLTLGLIASVANADFCFESSTMMPNLNGPDDDVSPCLSADGFSLYFSSIRSGDLGGLHDLWMATRSSTNEDFGTPVNLGAPVNGPYLEDCPYISADGTELYFTDGYFAVPSGHAYLLPGGFGAGDVWVSTRATTDDDWGTPTNLGANVNSVSYDGCPCLSADGLTLLFDSWRSDGSGRVDIWMTTRPTITDTWGPAVNLGPIVNSSQDEVGPRVLPNGLTLLFTSNREGSYDLWATRRATISEPWGRPVKLGSDNTDFYEVLPTFSPDGSTVYLCRGTGGNWDLWQAEVLPIVDFNFDGVVDSADVCIMVDQWGTNEPLCDIGPMPWGDGIIDVEDLKVLAEHLFEEVSDPTLIAHWPLDEAQGGIAYNITADCDGTLMGGPVWQPEGGVLAGALQFDGVDDYVSTDAVLNPADGSFSIFVWIKGGAPSQVIISQEGGASWLMADIADGALRTDLRTPEMIGRDAKPAGSPLICSTVVTDCDWHRVGFVRDGSDRILYVDDIEAVRDTAETLESASGGLYIGAASALEPDGFVSGLIDDVRICNRVVSF